MWLLLRSNFLTACAHLPVLYVRMCVFMCLFVCVFVYMCFYVCMGKEESFKDVVIPNFHERLPSLETEWRDLSKSINRCGAHFFSNEARVPLLNTPSSLSANCHSLPYLLLWNFILVHWGTRLRNQRTLKAGVKPLLASRYFQRTRAAISNTCMNIDLLVISNRQYMIMVIIGYFNNIQFYYCSVSKLEYFTQMHEYSAHEFFENVFVYSAFLLS